MKYSDVESAARALVREKREEDRKAKWDAAAQEIKELMLEIERTEELLTTMRDQLVAKMDEEVKDKSCSGYPLGGFVMSKADMDRVVEFNRPLNR